MTTNERNFQRLVKEGMDRYENAIESPSPKNRIKFANKCILKMKNALKLSDLLGLKDELGYIYEYISLSYSLIAESYMEKKDIKSAVYTFKKAKKANQKTLKNEETYIRACYIESKLLEVALLQKDWDLVDTFAKNIYKLTKKIDTIPRKVKYLRLSVGAFMKSKNIRWLKKTHKKLRKAGDSLDIDLNQVNDSNKERLFLKGTIYFDYADFLQTVLEKKRKSKSYFEDALEIFKTLNLNTFIKKIKKKLNQY